MDETQQRVPHDPVTGRTDGRGPAEPATVYLLEKAGRLTGPYVVPPAPYGGQTVHEAAGQVHAYDRSRDWFECPWCRSEVTGEELAHHDGAHECDETTLDR